MSTIVFFNIPAHGHINPTLPVVAELVRRGEQVIYYLSEAFRPQVEATGATFRPYNLQESAFSPPQNNAGPFIAMARILQVGEQVLEQVLPDVRATRPDAIIYDSMTPWGKQIARILGVPAICSCALFYVGPENLAAIGGPGPRVILSILRRLPQVAQAQWAYRVTARRIRQRYGVASPGTLDFFGNPGDITLLYTSRAFQTGAEKLNQSFKFVGPAIDLGREQGDFPWQRLEGGPVVYISLGTIFNERPEFFRTCTQAFSGTPYKVVIAAGDKVPLTSLGPIPANILVRPWIPQLGVLQRAQVFITHCGMNSASEGLWYGVPLLVAPQVGDQLFIAKRVVALGAGLAINSATVTPAELRAQVARVIGDGAFRRQSQALGESLRRAGGAVRAVEEIQAAQRRYGGKSAQA